nr:Ty3/gypsy retrotransposon protein [Tanacetum cinerariifolium]
MMEARLEDNQSNTTITKPNDLEETTFHKSNKVEETEARVEATVHKEKATTEKDETVKETADTLTSLQRDDPERWIFAITEYFSLLDAPADQRLRIVGFNLEGVAAEWFRWMSRNGLITTWGRFVESFKNRFGPSKYEDPQGALLKLLQLGTVEDYQREFEKLMNRVTVMYPLYLLDKDRDREYERTGQLASSWGMQLQPTRLKENSEQLCLYLQMPGGGKEEDVKVYVEHASIVIKGQIDQELKDKTGFKMYMCWLDLEFFDIYKFSDIKAEMRRNSGELKLTIPRTKEEEVSVFNVKVNIKD